MKINGFSYADCTPSAASLWACGVFGRVDLPDERLVKRCVRLTSDWASRPGVTIGRASGDKAAAKAGYRFVGNGDVPAECLGESVYNHGAKECAGQEEVYVAQDTTSLEYGHRGPMEGLGPVTTSGAQGLLIHSSLAVTQDGVPLGLLDQQVWTREETTKGPHKKRPIEGKESRKWLDGMRGSAGRVRDASAASVALVFVMDREGDIHEVFAEAEALGVDVIVRSGPDRCVKGAQRHLDAAIRAERPVGTYTVAVPRKRGERPSREAKLEIRHKRVTLDPPERPYPHREPIDLYCVLASEVDPPEGQRGLEWRLMTRRPVNSYDDAVRVTWGYTLRWRVEEFHLILKSGCRIESHQFRYGDRICKVVALLSAVAALLLRLTYLARLTPDVACTGFLSEFEAQVLRAVAASKLKEKATGMPTLQQAVLWIARLGGHSGRQRDSPPGVRTLWRGWADFQLMVEGARAALALQNCG